MRMCHLLENNLVQEVLDTGDTAVATARKLGILSFEPTTMPLSLTSQTQAILNQSAWATAPYKSGRVDVMVNNTGYSGPFEELLDCQIRR